MGYTYWKVLKQDVLDHDTARRKAYNPYPLNKPTTNEP